MSIIFKTVSFFFLCNRRSLHNWFDFQCLKIRLIQLQFMVYPSLNAQGCIFLPQFPSSLNLEPFGSTFLPLSAGRFHFGVERTKIYHCVVDIIIKVN